MDWLEAKGVLHWRCHLGGVKVKGARVRNAMKGFPDIAGVIPASGGRLFVIEVKQEDGRFSVEQLRWKDRLTAAGVTYVIATSVGDVETAMGVRGGAA